METSFFIIKISICFLLTICYMYIQSFLFFGRKK